MKTPINSVVLNLLSGAQVAYHHEHTAIPIIIGETVQEKANLFKQLCWEEVKVGKDSETGPAHTIFMQNPNLRHVRFEIVRSHIPQHEGFRVQSVAAHAKLCEHIRLSGEFTHLGEFSVSTADTTAEMYRHNKTGAVIQIVFRTLESDPFRE
ncbi:MAG: hypothetical protein RL094_346 [Candidatus Parcubacteria bacterium]|jgi:hypothetical protein